MSRVLAAVTAKPGRRRCRRWRRRRRHPLGGDDAVDEGLHPIGVRDVDDPQRTFAAALGQRGCGPLEQVASMSASVTARRSRPAPRPSRSPPARGAGHHRAHVAHVEQATEDLRGASTRCRRRRHVVSSRRGGPEIVQSRPARWMGARRRRRRRPATRSVAGAGRESAAAAAVRGRGRPALRSRRRGRAGVVSGGRAGVVVRRRAVVEGARGARVCPRRRARRPGGAGRRGRARRGRRRRRRRGRRRRGGARSTAEMNGAARRGRRGWGRRGAGPPS